MAARPRKVGSKDLPPNLYRRGDGFIYRNSKAVKSKSFRKEEKQDAINYAVRANHAIKKHLQSEQFKALTYPKSPKVSALLQEIKAKYLPRLNHAESTLNGEHALLKRFNDDLGKLLLAEIDQHKLSNYLDNTFEGNGRTKARGLLIHVYKYALSKGYCEANLADNTLPTVNKGKATQKHTEQGFEQIYSHAPTWLQDMMLFIKGTMLRPYDVRNLKKSDVDLKTMTIKVKISKTMNYKQPIYLKIFINDLIPEVAEVVKRRMTNPIVSPYLFCYRPTRTSQKALDAKPHWSYITKDTASKTFARVRAKSGAYSDLSVAERPTLRELRNFGSQTYKALGYPDAYIQKLMSHKDFETTQIYLDNGEPEYQEVRL